MINKADIKSILMSMRTNENAEIINRILGKLDVMDDIALQRAVKQVGDTEQAVKNFLEKKITEMQNDNIQEHISINEMFSYGISGNCIHLHLSVDLHKLIF